MFENLSLSPAEQIAQINAALQKATQGPDLQKTFTQSSNQLTGLTAFSLEAPAKTFYPMLTPLRNMLPRAVGGVGIQANWRAITGVNSQRARVGVSEGNRGQNQAVTIREYAAVFRTIGIDSFVTEEARLAGEGFDDVEARAVQSNLNALMVAEEMLILGGLGTYGLGQPTGLTAAAVVGGGSIGNTIAVNVRVCALTLEGYVDALGGTVAGLITRQTANGVTDTFGGGYSRASAVVVANTTGANSRVQCAVTPVRGAVAYAWFVSNNDANVMRLMAVTTTSATTITALPAGTEPLLGADLIANDRSQNALSFDGFFSLIASNNSGAYWQALPNGVGQGTPLTSDNAGGIVEIDAVLRWYWDNHRIGPQKMFVNAQELNNFRRLGIIGTSASTQRFVFNTDQRNILLSGRVRGYTNPFAMGGAQEVTIELHPNVPPGTIFFMCQSLPYSLPGVTDVNRILCRRDYYQLVYPQTRRAKEFGVYSDQLLQTYFPPANAVLTNIAPPA